MPRRTATRRFWAWLALAVGLLVAGLLVLMAIFLRQARLAEEAAQLQADSVTAMVFQFEREFLRLRSAVELTTAQGPQNPKADWDGLALRFDIFLSRLNLLLDSPAVNAIREREEYQRVVPDIQAMVQQMTPWMDNPAAHHRELSDLSERLQTLGPEMQSLSFASNAMITRQMSQQVGTLRGQSRMIVGLFAAQVLLLMLVAASIVVRQRRQERERLALEKINQALEHARQQAEQANVAKGHFLANMSHELRTPFNGMLGMLQLLHETPLDTRQRDYLNTAADSAQHLLTLLNDILDMAAIEEGKLKIKPESIDLQRVVRDVIHPMSAQAREKGLAFETDISPDLPPTVWLDPTRVRQVLFNLLSNAIKFTERGSVTLGLCSEPAADGHTVTLVFTVRDTGIGMSAQAVDRLFERFYQVDSSLKRRRGGSGLGLHISRTLVELMGGEIALHSTEGQGSVFTLRIPTHATARADSMFADTAPPPPLPAVESMSGACPAPPSPAGLKVLVVDDHPVNQKLASALLQRMGHEVHQSVNGLEALQRVTAEDFDLVLMDLHMPEMDGLDATRAIRQLAAPRGRVPVVALTANALETAQRETEDAGFDGFLTKPLKVVELQAVLAHYRAARHPM